MSNHYHWLVETPEPNLIAGMSWFQTTWTVRFNRRHRLNGHLFQGRYKAVVVDPEADGYFPALSDYIHLNPVRAGIISLEQRLFDYPWSSYRWFVASTGRAKWFEPGRVLGALDLQDTRADRRHYAERMRNRAVMAAKGGEEEPELAALRNGWCLGGESFRERMLGLLDGTGKKLSQRREIDATVRHSHDEGEARRLLALGLEHFGLAAGDLGQLPKGDFRKLTIARAIRARTMVPNGWIARELRLGHPSRLNHIARAKEPQIAMETERLLERTRF